MWTDVMLWCNDRPHHGMASLEHACFASVNMPPHELEPLRAKAAQMLILADVCAPVFVVRAAEALDCYISLGRRLPRA